MPDHQTLDIYLLSLVAKAETKYTEKTVYGICYK